MHRSASTSTTNHLGWVSDRTISKTPKPPPASAEFLYSLYIGLSCDLSESRFCDPDLWPGTVCGVNARYHWLSEGLASFVDAPHAAIAGEPQGEIVNLADRRAEPSRRGQLALLASLGPDRIMREVRQLSAEDALVAPRDQASLPHLVMPAHHDVRSGDVNIRRLHATLAAAADAGPRDFAELLLTPGIGARTVRSLAMVAEIVHGAPYRFADPARFSIAHGGKDRHPFPVPIAVYDQRSGC